MEFVEMDDLDVGYFDHDWESPPPKGRKHLITIEVDEGDSDISPLVMAIITSFAKDVEAMRDLLRREEVTVSYQYRRTAAGRYSLVLKDHAKTMLKRLTLDRNHYLVTVPAEEPGNGTWTDEFDWAVEHSEECTPEVRYDDLCPFQVDIEMVGRDIFGDPKDWDDPPFRKRIQHVVEHSPGGPWGAEEWDSYVREDPEEEEGSDGT